MDEGSAGWRVSGFSVALFCFVFVVLAYFFGSADWNQNARLDAIYNFVEPGPDRFTFKINRFLWNPASGSNTGDWALYGGDYFANKAPGTILLGVGAYLPLHWFETSVAGLDVSTPLVEILNAYAINVFVSVTFASLGAVAFLRLLKIVGVRQVWALWLTLAAFLGTAVFPYTTQLWGTSTTTACVVLGYLAIVRGTPRSLAFAGFMLGMAVVMDYLAVLFVLLGSAALLVSNRRQVFTFAAGGLVPLIIVCTYHYVCFDSILVAAPSLSAKSFVAEDRLLGFFSWPDPTAMWQLSFGLQRGVFVQMPVLLLSFPGFVLWWRRNRRDTLLWLALSSFVVPFLVVSSFNGWHGGQTVAARYLIPALVWLVLPLKELVELRFCKPTIIGLTLVSAFNMLTIAATNPLGINSKNPLYGWAYPHFLAADTGPIGLPTRLQALHPDWPRIAPYTCFNWGEIFGLDRMASIVPFFTICVLGAAALFWQAAKRPDW